MMRTFPLTMLLLAGSLGLSTLGCQSGGVGDPCIPEDEYRQDFNGYAFTEVNVESKSFQCETRVCIVNHFQGRVSCPYGQTQEAVDPGPDHQDPTSPARCRIPGTDGSHCVSGNQVQDCSNGGTNIDEITVAVDPQRLSRSAQDTVYCSCRCDGPDKSARYCECPSGYECASLVRELGLPGKAQLAGSYCVKSGTVFDPQKTVKADACDANNPGTYDICGNNGKNP